MVKCKRPFLSVCGVAGLAASVFGVATPLPLAAQPVVQPLPGPEVERLNAALLKLAKRPSNLNALIEAGEAAIGVGDLDAALGFYGRAREINSDNARVTMGLAKVYLSSGRPVAALPLFAEARAAGQNGVEIQVAQALALDMVGDQAGAQAGYNRVLTIDPQNTVARRRLSISHAISGNRAAFEETLRPLVERRDFASFRARAFGLAILGEENRAGAIVDAVMPRNLAQRITPYLEFMPRLTPAQQAAAANLGIFPRAADIGRDTPTIAVYDPGKSSALPVAAPVSTRSASAAGSRLEPTGTPLGTSKPTREAQPARVADAFSDILQSDTARSSGDAASGAVDITAIEVPRETANTRSAKPPKPVNPRRIWVQLATGRDLTALAFDWRRLKRKAPGLLDDLAPYTVRWGRTNRLLVGPVGNAREARTLVNALNKKGIKTFAYTSPKGQEIQQLEKR